MSNTNDVKKLIEEEREVLKEQKEVLADEKAALKQMKRQSALVIVGAAVIVAALAVSLYARTLGSQVNVTKAQIIAPAIDLAPQNAGTLKETYVHEGDVVSANAPIARVGNEIIKATQGGLIIAVKTDIGKLFNRGESVATM